MTLGSLILLRGQYSSRVKAITIVAWMMNRTRGSAGFGTVGLSPSKIPACEGALAAVAVAAAAAVVVVAIARDGDAWSRSQQLVPGVLNVLNP